MRLSPSAECRDFTLVRVAGLVRCRDSDPSRPALEKGPTFDRPMSKTLGYLWDIVESPWSFAKSTE